MPQSLRRAARLSAASALTGALVLMPLSQLDSALAASPQQPMTGARPAVAHHVNTPRVFDSHLLVAADTARVHHDAHPMAMNHRLWVVAHRYAKHLARTHQLVHNPKLEQQASKACPNWTDIGENIAETGGGHSLGLFSAYMHSAPHRANLLDTHYAEVGIASVRTTVNGVVEQWNVMDFGNHCPA